MVVVLATVVATSPCAAQRQPGSSDAATIVFQHINDVVQAGTTKLSNGVEVQRADWPALIMAQIPNPGTDKPRTCTASLVGPNVVLLAAHCVDSWEGKARSAQLRVASRKIAMRCEMHPDYVVHEYQFAVPRDSADYALCLLQDEGVAAFSFADIRFEVVETASSLRAGDDVLMTGYGCDKLKVAASGVLDWAPNSSVLRIGDSRVEFPTGQWPLAAAYVTTVSPEGREPALCPGDSGGPLFSGVTSRAPNGLRRIRGVNSKICARRRGDATLCSTGIGPGTWDIVSSMAATDVESFRVWAVDWIARNHESDPILCGVNRSAGTAPCRD